MILLHKGKRYAPLYPDGSFNSPVEVKRKVRIDWTRAAEAASPAKYEPDAINCKFLCLPHG